MTSILHGQRGILRVTLLSQYAKGSDREGKMQSDEDKEDNRSSSKEKKTIRTEKQLATGTHRVFGVETPGDALQP